jgi:hypothetical protein
MSFLLFGFQRTSSKNESGALKTKQEFTFLRFQRLSTKLVFLLRKEVIHPHVPVGIPCYDLTPIIDPTFDGSLPLLG